MPDEHMSLTSIVAGRRLRTSAYSTGGTYCSV
jgi:hypothetical protein